MPNVPAVHVALAAARVHRIEMSARELVAFEEGDPDLASECAVETPALEARMILASGTCRRLAENLEKSLRQGTQAVLSGEDWGNLTRLEGVVALATNRIELKMAALDAATAQGGFSQLGSVIGLATGAVGLIRSIF